MKTVHTAITTASVKNFVAPLVEADLDSLKIDSEIWADNKVLYKSKISGRYISVKKRKCHFSANLFKSFFRLILLLILLGRTKPDLIVAHFSRGAILPLLAAWILGVDRRVYFNHGLPYLGHGGATRLVLKALDYFNCFFAHEVITVNKLLVNYINNDIAPHKKVHTLGAGSCCGISDDYFSSYTENEKYILKRRLGINQKSVIFLYVGRPVKRKGYLVAYDAFCTLKRNQPSFNLKLLMAGISSKDLLRSRNLIDDDVVALGFRDNMKQLYGIADVVFLPSFHEGFPYCLLEGGAQKCALIASKLPGLDEIIIDSETGYFVDPNDIDKISQVLYKAASNPVRLSRMGEDCFEKIKSFKRSKVVNEYESLIVSLLNKNKKNE